MARVVITGCDGQDGYYLSALLRSRGEQVFGFGRDTVRDDAVPLGPLDLLNRVAVHSLLAKLQPHAVYHLAAFHHSAEDRPQNASAILAESRAVHVDALGHLLEAMEATCPQARLFYPASSRIFGDPPQSPQTELTPFAPRDAYGITKVEGIDLCRRFRRHGLFVAVGILYNHESPRRPERFVTRRVAKAVAAIRRGRQDQLTVGNLAALVDWGFAPDYVDAMARIVALRDADDFIVATGRTATVGDFIAAAFAAAGISGEGRIVEKPEQLAEAPPRHILVGDYSKLARATGWRPAHDVAAIARIMVEAELAKND